MKVEDKTMSEKTFWSCNTVRELAQTFAEIVKQNYLSDLKYWLATARDSPYEFKQWNMRIKKEPNKVKRNAKRKILKIMKEPKENAKFYKRISRFWNYTVISITKSSGFYDDLLKGKNIGNAFAVNVEYIIDETGLTIVKNVYSQDEIL